MRGSKGGKPSLARAEEAGEGVGAQASFIGVWEAEGPDELHNLQFNPGLFLMMICIKYH